VTHVPSIRVRIANSAPVNASACFVLYWMIAFRRIHWTFALQRAVEWANELQRPLVVLEGLRAGYGWACDRFHAFILEGMAENQRRVEDTGALYYPYVEREPDEGKGFLAALARHACVVVTDDFPEFFLPRMVASAASQVPVRLEQVDSNGLLPLRATDQAFPTAFAFRRFLQENLPAHLAESPVPVPLASLEKRHPPSIPKGILDRWPRATETQLRADEGALAPFPIDHQVAKVPIPGGSGAAGDALKRFLSERLPRYAELRNHPEKDVTSGLSPYLHFGHISSHEVFHELMADEGWSPADLAARASGSRQGWWGVSEEAEAFLDQLVTWRELGFNMCAHGRDYDRYESLPAWARKTLEDHARDPRPALYERPQFEAARTHDPLWNAAQTQLVREGRMHNYLRMLWGKKVLEWSATPREALDIMIHLNNRYGLDGRDPNSYSGIFWCLARYDRPWGPERPVFGKIRYMSSQNTARKVRVEEYIRKYAP
jgi:deoxyribodipyrimidine photo-lyase